MGEREKLSPTHLVKLLLVKQLVESSQALEDNLWFHSDPSKQPTLFQQLMSHTQQSTWDNKSILVFCVYSSCFYEGYSEMFSDFLNRNNIFTLLVVKQNGKKFYYFVIFVSENLLKNTNSFVLNKR